jgi:hypothetical protein
MLHLDHSFVWCWNLYTWKINEKHPGSLKCGAGWWRITVGVTVTNEDVLHRVKEERDIVYTLKERKTNWISHTLCRNCLLKHVIPSLPNVKYTWRSLWAFKFSSLPNIKLTWRERKVQFGSIFLTSFPCSPKVYVYSRSLDGQGCLCSEQWSPLTVYPSTITPLKRQQILEVRTSTQLKTKHISIAFTAVVSGLGLGWIQQCAMQLLLHYSLEGFQWRTVMPIFQPKLKKDLQLQEGSQTCLF